MNNARVNDWGCDACHGGEEDGRNGLLHKLTEIH